MSTEKAQTTENATIELSLKFIVQHIVLQYLLLQSYSLSPTLPRFSKWNSTSLLMKLIADMAWKNNIIETIFIDAIMCRKWLNHPDTENIVLCLSQEPAAKNKYTYKLQSLKHYWNHLSSGINCPCYEDRAYQAIVNCTYTIISI